jgi:hypothetical protein
MEQQGLSPHDLIPFIGGRNRVCEVLARKRSLTLKMIWRLHNGLGIPAESPHQGRAAAGSLVDRDHGPSFLFSVAQGVQRGNGSRLAKLSN